MSSVLSALITGRDWPRRHLPRPAAAVSHLLFIPVVLEKGMDSSRARLLGGCQTASTAQLPRNAAGAGAWGFSMA